VALISAGCARHGRDSGDDRAGGGRAATDTNAGNTDTNVKQGGGVPPQPARLDRADPPLVEAARSGDVKRVRQLLDGGADVNAFGNQRTTALMAAAEAGREDVARLLVERRADANLRNAKGQTAAELAEASGHKSLRGLLERKEVKPPPGPANPVPPAK
jgi:hypothetical protein